MKLRFLPLVGVLLVAACSSGGSGSSGSPAKCSSSGNVTCPNGAAVQACVVSNLDGSCQSTYYMVGSQTFNCASCSDCTQAIHSATQACAGNSGTGGSGGGSGGSGGSGGLPPGNSFLGNWSCNGTSTVTFTTPPGMQPTSSPITATISITAAGAQILINPTGDAGTSCQPLAYTPAGSTATLSPGQSCTQTQGGQTSVITYTGGSLSLAQGQMSVLVQFNMSSTGAQTITGSGTITETCTKQ